MFMPEKYTPNANGVVKSLSQLRVKFNMRFGYPHVFLNEEPFSNEFRWVILGLTKGAA
jgi:alpha 1,2-mannosyltransferase